VKSQAVTSAFPAIQSRFHDAFHPLRSLEIAIRARLEPRPEVTSCGTSVWRSITRGKKC